MSIDKYIEEIRNKKVFEEGVISVVEKRKASPFNLPRADSDTHIVVLKVQGNLWIFHRLLNETNPGLSVGDLYRQYLFISVRMTPKTLRIPPKQYYLQGHSGEKSKEITVTVTLKYQVIDARRIVTEEDVLDEIEAGIHRWIGIYLNQLSIVDDQVELERNLKDKIENEYPKTNTSSSVKIENPNVSIELSPELRASIVKDGTRGVHKVEATKYNLKDRTEDPVEVAVSLFYKTTTTQLAQEHQNALEQLEILVSDAITTHMNRVSKVDFSQLQNTLRKKIEEACQPPDIDLKLRVERVSVDINFTVEQMAHLESISGDKRTEDRKHKQERYRLEQESETKLRENELDEKHKSAIDRRLQNDMMYGMPLKDVIMKVDPALLIDFYNQDWNQGLMNLRTRLIERVAEEKKRLEEDGTRQLKDLQNKIKLLEETGVDARDIEDLREKMVAISKTNDPVNMPSDVEIRNIILSEPFPVSQPSHRLTSGTDNDGDE